MEQPSEKFDISLFVSYFTFVLSFCKKEFPLVVNKDLIITFSPCLFIQSFAVSFHFYFSGRASDFISSDFFSYSALTVLGSLTFSLSLLLFDYFSMCFTLLLHIPLFIFVTQSFLRSLFPCLTHSLSILISLSVYSPLFSVSMSKSVRVLRSLLYLSLSPSPSSPSICLAISFCLFCWVPPVTLLCSLFHSLYLFLFLLSLSKKAFLSIDASLSHSVLSSHTEYGCKSSSAFSVYHSSPSVYNLIDLESAPCLLTQTCIRISPCCPRQLPF